MEIRTYSRKQAGVIYSAMKRGEIEVSADVISEMYDMAGSAFVSNTNDSSYVESFAAAIKNAVDFIFQNNYASAEKTLANLA